MHIANIVKFVLQAVAVVSGGEKVMGKREIYSNYFLLFFASCF
jgi:hypothetical protein